MEESLQEEVKKLVDFIKPELDKPFNLNRILNISLLNALWFIMAGEKLELDNPKLPEILSTIDDLTRYLLFNVNIPHWAQFCQK